MTLSHILIPTDFSDSSRLAVEYALALREKFSAEITLLHVVEPYFGYGIEIIPSLDVEACRERAAEQRLQELAAGSAAGIPVKTRHLTGKPWHVICKWAAENRVDLIVMPTHGHAGLQHLWAGSVAERVVQKAPCPVLVVREKP